MIKAFPIEQNNMGRFKQWLERLLSNPEAVVLVGMLGVGFFLIAWWGDILAPVLASIVLAYLLEGVVGKLVQIKIARSVSVVIVFTLFLALLAYLLFGLIPKLSIQAVQLAQQLPSMLNEGKTLLLQLPQKYPEFISEIQLNEIFEQVRTELISYGQELIALSASSVVGLVTLIIYLFLVPMMVFFFLMDKEQIGNWMASYLPKDRRLSQTVWADVNIQIANYVRGKVWEIVIVWVVSFVAFKFLGMNYAMLMGFLVGISVLIPYVGATVVTIPVVLVAFFQWGWGPDFYYAAIVFFVIQALDGYVLVPLLFSEAVNIHPVAIIIAILFFGGLWGFWGVFFAIPLATLVKAVLLAWPSHEDQAVV